MKKLGTYKNGNYIVTMFDDGTKIRQTKYDDFIPAFPENIDVKLTDKCSIGCPFCYENCTPNGKHSVIDFKSRFLNSLHPFTELALNGNDMDHPQLEELLVFLKGKSIITNITVNQKQLKDNFDKIKDFQERGLLYGIGVSLTDANDELVEMMSKLNNTVLHTICGILSENDINILKNKNIKLLILGYKDLGRGVSWKKNNPNEFERNRSYLYDTLPKMAEMFNVVSFDNLSLKQLDVRRLLTDKEWEEFYMGDDGNFTFYADLVKNEFAMNSLSQERKPIGNLDVHEMFSAIRNKQ